MPKARKPKGEGEPRPKEEVTPFERMRRLTKAVVRVPKEEAIKRKRA